MDLDRGLVQQVATLARLRLSDEQLDRVTAELAQVVHLVEQLDELDTEGVEPLACMNEEAGSDARAQASEGTLRGTAEDVAHESLPREAALANAPKQDGECYLVPPVL